jgi:hypothetical protein
MARKRRGMGIGKKIFWGLALSLAAVGALKLLAQGARDVDGDGDRDVDDLVAWLNKNVEQPWRTMGLAALRTMVLATERATSWLDILPDVLQVDLDLAHLDKAGPEKKRRVVAQRRARAKKAA